MSFPELTNIQIDNYYSGNPNYGGCVNAHDTSMMNPGKFYILTLDSNPFGEGTHWVLLYLVNKNEAIYFDSFGLPPAERISWFCRRFKNRMRNIGQIQDIKSSSCGWYCLYVCDKLLSGMNFADVVESFNTRGTVKGMHNNEKVLQRYFL